MRPGIGIPLLLLVLAGPVIPGTSLCAQYDVPLVSTVFDPADFGLSSAADVRRGRVSLAWHPDGVRLSPYYLRSDPVQPRVTYPNAQSFYNLGPAAMRAATGEIVRYLEGELAFAGLAFRDYAGLSHLLSREEPSR
ncbi:MAG: hypothetical protein OXU33_08965 [Gemmatimonadota bacterium]|nr:hypothetical protein [Gemmatimonadota bacterium]MDE3005206.1 hypothetical protein [Gemmatimonadota bacterium]MDE3014193.1 hypothetical protein [Gemmatimonadota bacterium]